MPRYTMARTWPDKPDDYVFRVDGRDAGRCYHHALKRLEWCWHWTLYRSSVHGDEMTLEAAQAKFKIAFEKMIEVRAGTRVDNGGHTRGFSPAEQTSQSATLGRLTRRARRAET